MKLKQTKLLDREIVKPVRFYEGFYNNLDTKYFINKIDKNLSTNLNRKTNIKGGMTEFDFFKTDKKFFSGVKSFGVDSPTFVAPP